MRRDGCDQRCRLALVAIFLFICKIAAAARPVAEQIDPHLGSHKKQLNLRPLIGVLSQGGDPAPDGYSYIAASYIKFIEAAGARAVPILHDMDKAEVTRRFNAVNGILIPGGAQPLYKGQPFFDTASLLFDLTIKANDAGDYFPVRLIISTMSTNIV